MTSPFNIKKVNLFSSWVYNVPKNEECTICRCNLNVQSLYNQEKCIDSFVVTGKCGHSFHFECIKPWVNKNNHCPLCSQMWEYIPIIIKN
jgi:hypothetical protein